MNKVLALINHLKLVIHSVRQVFLFAGKEERRKLLRVRVPKIDVR